MLFWIVAGTLAAAVAALLARPLLRPSPDAPAPPPDQAIYRDQLLEVDRDLARGVLAPDEADRARTEIARRLLAADREGPRPVREAPPRATLAAVAVAAVLTVAGSLLLYATLGRPHAADLPRADRIAQAQALRDARPSQAQAEAQAAALYPRPDLPDDYAAMVEDLRRIVPTRPDDLRGWELLAVHEARTGRYDAAARAQERVIALKGDAATARDHADLADRMVAAAGGVVTPETEAVLADLQALDPADPALLYYLGLLEAQTGRPDRAFPLWRAVVEDAPPDSLAYRLAAPQIEDVAWLAGVDYAPPDAPGPTPEQVAAAGDMDPAAQADMIRSMVDGLARRLADEGGPPEDWARLIASLGVLGETDRASAILAEARATFAAIPEAQALLDRAERDAGLLE